MTISGIQSGLIGMAIFDMYMDAVRKTHGKPSGHGDPLVAAAAKAFESYLNGQNAIHNAQIQAVSYMLNPGGGSTSPVTSQQIAPFLALNLLA